MADNTKDKVEAVKQAAQELSNRENAEVIATATGCEQADKIVSHVRGQK